MWVDILIWWIIFSVAYTIGYGIYCLFRPLFRRNKQKPKPQPNRAVHIQQAPPTIHIQQTRPTVISTQHISTHVSHSSTSDYKPPIITPPPATEPKEPIVTPPPAKPKQEEKDDYDSNDPYNHLEITFDMVFKWEQVDDEESRLIFYRRPIVADIDFKSNREWEYRDARYYEYKKGELIEPISVYGRRLEYDATYRSREWKKEYIKYIRVLLPEYMQGWIFRISDHIERYGDHLIADGECLLWVYAGKKADACRAEQSRLDEIAEEERRQKALEEEKAEIAAKIKAKHRKQQLEKIVRQELVDSGELFGEQAKRPRIPREVVDAVYSRDGGRCVYCGSTDNLQLDHIIPFSRGGATNVENLQLLCQKCNLEKSNKIG